MANQTERLLHEARAGLSDLHKTLGRAVRVAQTPDDPALLELDRKIDEQSQLVKRLERMVEAGKEAESEEAIRIEKHRKAASKDKALQILRTEAAPAAKEYDAWLKAGGVIAAKLDDIGARCAAEVANVNRGLPSGWVYSALNAARLNDGRFVAALEHALHRYGIGTVGVTLDTLPRKPLGDFYTFEEAVRLVTQRLEIQLQNMLDNANQQLDMEAGL